ncbi:MAG: RsmD family RNA methyltransferase [Prevotella sp.]|nr:RsmD family RNA methyltransferase [Prevotella sp.]
MRIVTGRYKGRHFDIQRTFKARPTTDFAKENIFNVLNGYIDFDGATALDLFAGTGSISLELLSRGCAQVVAVELDRDHHRFIQQCLQKLQATSGAQSGGMDSTLGAQPAAINCQCIRADVFRFVKSCRQQFDCIFADPPYALKELPSIPDIVFERQLLKAGGIFVFEHGHDHNFAAHPHFVEHRQYGSVNFSLFR